MSWAEQQENAYLGFKSRDRQKVGEIATESTVSELVMIAQDLIGRFGWANRPFDDDLVCEVAKTIGGLFPFEYRDYGVSTIAKQLEAYQKIKKPEKLKMSIDCRMPACVAAYTYHQLATPDIQVKFWQIHSTGYHPHVLILTPQEGWEMDFLPVIDSPNINYLTNDKVRNRLSNPYFALPLNLSSLQILDTNFLANWNSSR